MLVVKRYLMPRFLFLGPLMDPSFLTRLDLAFGCQPRLARRPKFAKRISRMTKTIKITRKWLSRKLVT
jgi:hypothetical protein